MPSLRKLSATEVTALTQPQPGARARIAQEYDEYVASFSVGEYGQAELLTGERRRVVRIRLQAAARRRGLQLRFRPGPGSAMIFYVEAIPRSAPAPALPAAPEVERRSTSVSRQHGAPSRPPRQPQTSTQRYREVLPR